MTPKDYLEVALSPLEGSGPGVTEKNQMRSSIKALFPDRDCCMLVRPVADEESLLRLDSLDQRTLRAEFREVLPLAFRGVGAVQGVQKLMGMLNEKTKPKTLGSVIVTGSMLAGLAQAYVQAINSGAVPVISSAWTVPTTLLTMSDSAAESG